MMVTMSMMMMIMLILSACLLAAKSGGWSSSHWREACCLQTVQLLLHTGWEPQDTHAHTLGREILCLHTMQLLSTHVHKLMTSKNVCSPIQERSLLFTQPFGCSQCTTPQNLKMHNAHPFVQEKGISDVSSATILAIVLVISRITSPRTLEENSLPVSNATTLAVTQIV